MKINHVAPHLLLLGKGTAFQGIAPKKPLKPFLVTKKYRPHLSLICPRMLIAGEEKIREGTSVSTVNDSSSVKPSVYEELGFKEEQIALGINPQEVLQWLGTRGDLITKLLEDNNNKLDRTQAEREIDKLLMDYEVVSRFIAYKKWATENPEVAAKVAEVAAKEGKINFQEISLYALWIAAGVGLSYVSKIVRGYWDAGHPEVPNLEG